VILGLCQYIPVLVCLCLFVCALCVCVWSACVCVYACDSMSVCVGLGGTCVNVGCIPKKLIHYTALLREL